MLWIDSGISNHGAISCCFVWPQMKEIGERKRAYWILELGHRPWSRECDYLEEIACGYIYRIGLC